MLNFDDEQGGAYPRDLYSPIATAPRIDVDAALSDDAREHYREHGWLAVRGLLEGEAVADAAKSIDALVSGEVPGFGGISYERQFRDRVQTLSPAEHYDAVRKLYEFVPHEPRLARIALGDRIGHICRHLLNCEVRLFQDMALLKPPRAGREKPWHQDHAFFNYPLGTKIIGVWIAVDEATVANGCMQVLDGGHIAGPRLHFRRRDWQICDTEMTGERSVAFPLEPGDAMFFDGLLPHGTPANTSGERRRALQFHYMDSAVPPAKEPGRLAIFGGEGAGATC
ncbi:MAG: phytanoyl-CoA dioxygenase family protein [Rhizobiaceae bacterium]|nr:phytanoyl-CoA dioxygenase family protein [Rhizobiaceae bacterium]